MAKLSDQERYLWAAHAMQSGVRLKMSRDGAPDDSQFWPGETSPKSLRVGINAAMSDHGALADLLIRKGVITREEYLSAVADAMEREVELYRRELGLPDNASLA